MKLKMMLTGGDDAGGTVMEQTRECAERKVEDGTSAPVESGFITEQWQAR